MSAIMKKEREFFLQENRYEEANGFYSRSLQLAIGKLDLKIPRIRMGNSFRPALLPSRWKRLEGVYFCIKRTFREYVTTKFVNMAREMAMKAHIYNMFITAMVQKSDVASARPTLEGRVMQQSIDERSLKNRFSRIQY